MTLSTPLCTLHKTAHFTPPRCQRHAAHRHAAQRHCFINRTRCATPSCTARYNATPSYASRPNDETNTAARHTRRLCPARAATRQLAVAAPHRDACAPTRARARPPPRPPAVCAHGRMCAARTRRSPPRSNALSNRCLTAARQVSHTEPRLVTQPAHGPATRRTAAPCRAPRNRPVTQLYCHCTTHQ